LAVILIRLFGRGAAYFLTGGLA